MYVVLSKFISLFTRYFITDNSWVSWLLERKLRMSPEAVCLVYHLVLIDIDRYYYLSLGHLSEAISN